MTPAELLILLLEAFDKLDPIAQLGAAGTVFSAIGGPLVWAWRRGRKHAAELIETNRKLTKQLEDSAKSISKIEQKIEDNCGVLATMQAQVPAEALASAASDKVRAPEILTGLFEQLAPPLGTCCREIAFAEVALTLDAKDRPHLHRAERLAEAAELLAPGEQGELRALRADIAAMRAVWEENAGAFAAADGHWNTAFDYVGGAQPEIAVPLSQRLHEIGMRRYREGHYAVAVILLRRAILIAERTLGPRQMNTLAMRSNLGSAFNAQGRSAEAEALYLELQPLQEKLLGREHPHTLTTRNNLAHAIDNQGRVAEAEALHREILSLREKVLGREHPHTLTTRNNLGSAINAQGRSAEAEALHREVLSLREKVLGREHPDTLTTRHNLAGAVHAQGRSAEAEALYHELLPLREKVLGREHPHTVITRNMLAAIISAENRSVEAEGATQEARQQDVAGDPQSDH